MAQINIQSILFTVEKKNHFF